MPQMAPVMWMDLFILITFLLLATLSMVYFISNKTTTKLAPTKNHFKANWLW